MKKLLSLIFIFISINLVAQKEANRWYFGNHAGLNFNTLPPTVLTDSKMDTEEGCSSFSDSNGNLLFYSDGTTVYDKNHNIMKYTDGSLANNLKGDPSSTQSGMIIPKPGSKNIYYLFTVYSNKDFGLNVYTIDMDLNMGSGQLIDEDGDGLFFEDLSNGELFWSEKITAVKGKKCNQFWIVSVYQKKFYAYEITTAGINLVPITSTVTNFNNPRGYLKLSPDGTKLAVANQGNFNAVLYNFDNETGKITDNGIKLLNNQKVDGEPYGMEFSADSKKVYFSTVSGVRFTLADNPTTYRLFQFDLTAPDIVASKITIHQQVAGSQNFPQGGFRGALQLGPDSKIYATIPLTYNDDANGGDSNHFLDVIENPTADGNAVIFTKNAINLGNSAVTQGLPPFIASLFLPIELPIELTNTTTNLEINNKTLQYCLMNDVVIQSAPIQIQAGTPILYKWSFTNNGGNTSVISDDPDLTINDIKFTDAGDYTLEVTFTDTCGNPTTLKGTFTVEVYNNITIEEPNDLNDPDVDGDGFVTYDFTTKVTPIVLGAQVPAGKEIIYFTTEPDALANTNPIPNPLNYTNRNVLVNETIWVRIHNQAVPNTCYEIRDFKLIISNNPPVVTSPVTLTLCDDNADGIATFNLTNANPLISDNSADETFMFFESLPDAENNVVANKIINPAAYNNQTATNDHVFVRITNASNLSATAQLNLVVNPLPVVTSPITLTLCDDNADGIATFNLTSATALISNNFANETFTFFENLADAENNMIANKIVNPTTYNNQTATNDHVFVRIENANCFVTAQVNLTVNSLPIVTPVVNIGQCDDNADLITIVNLTLRQSAISANYATETFQYFATEANAIAGAPQIANPIQYPVNANGQVWVRTISSKGCYVISKINISIAFADNVLYNRIFTECDDFLDADGNDTAANSDSDGITTFDFSEARNNIYNDPAIVGVPNLEIKFYENQLDRAAEINEIPDISNYRNNKYLAYANEQTIYVKIINTINKNCRGIAKLTLRVNSVPDFEVTSPQAICLNNAINHITLVAENPKENYTYQWVDTNGVNLGATISQEVTVSGEYTVTATTTDGTMCTKSRTIVVNESTLATITNDDVTINDDIYVNGSNTNSITINTTNLGIGDYEFALLNESGIIVRKYQNEPVFKDIEGGIYTITVQDKSGCGVASLTVAVIQFPKFFTPNGDGINDTWTVKGGVANFFPENNVSIFNRQGKLISQFNFNTKGWNGFYKGNQMPSTDYWFKVRAVDKQGNIYNKKGHFSLLRK